MIKKEKNSQFFAKLFMLWGVEPLANIFLLSNSNKAPNFHIKASIAFIYAILDIQTNIESMRPEYIRSEEVENVNFLVSLIE